MNERFQIDDLMTQGPSGIVFRATDKATGESVALRRYFPFGRGCGGLDEEACKAYTQSLDDLSSINHPSLRKVLGGGCDEIDQLPCIVTEWVDGESVESLVSRAMLGVNDVASLLGIALDTSIWLSQVFQKESLWVETELSAVVLKNSGKPDDFNFCISPVKWLGISGPDHDLKLLAGFATQLLQGVPMTTGDAKQSGLLRWIEWLLAAPASTTLKQAREKLDQHLQPRSAAPVRKTPAPPPQQSQAAIKNPKRKPKAMLCANLLLACTVIGLASYAYQMREGRFGSKKPSASQKAGKSIAKQSSKKKDSAPQAKSASKAVESTPGELIAWDNNSKLMENNRRHVTIEGPAGRIDQSKSGKTLYLVFFGGDKPESSRIGIRLGKCSPDKMKSDLGAFVGKKIRASGEVKKEMQGNLSSPAVMVNDVSAIQIID